MLELDGEARAKKLGHIKRLVEEFCDDGRNALERWFSEMGIAWVLSLDDDADADGARQLLPGPGGASSSSRGASLQHLARSWILGLREIKDSTLIYMDGLCDEEEDAESTCQPDDLSEFSRFIQSAFFKMIPFVDAIAALTIVNHPPSAEKTAAAAMRLQALIDVRDGLSTASEEIQFGPYSSIYYVESAAGINIIDEMSDLMSSKLGKLDKAIWDTMDEIRTGLMADAGGDDGDLSATLSSPDIHKLTRSVITFVNLLDANYILFSRIAHEAAQLGSFVPEIPSLAPLTSLMMEMFSRLEEKLVSMSQSSFQYDSLGFLFLINNSHFIWQQLHPLFDMAFPMAVLNRKIDDYIQSYLQVSWGPVMSCLYNDPRPLRLGRYSPLPQFEFEFHKVYSAQKLWKVPDPELRGRLRKAIVSHPWPPANSPST
jgi:hypothetical protein